MMWVLIGYLYGISSERKLVEELRMHLAWRWFTGLGFDQARAILNRLMREVGPMSDAAPEFPLAAAPLAPLRAKSELTGSTDFTPMWSGQAAVLARELPAAELTKQLALGALKNLRLLKTAARAA
jgi:NAD(P)H-dependent flavin oxidoreductase YrpB (nitropropane dioxygenase family)